MFEIERCQSRRYAGRSERWDLGGAVAALSSKARAGMWGDEPGCHRQEVGVKGAGQERGVGGRRLVERGWILQQGGQ